MNQSQKFVEYALQIGALELLPKKRELKSGRLSPYFFNSGLFCSGLALTRLADAYATAISRGLDEVPEVIFGPAYKGITLAAAVSMALSSVIDSDVKHAFNRKEVKGHGEGGIIVGASLMGQKVCIVDDVITTGGSVEEAYDIIVAQGGTPVGCCIAFDRQERGLESHRSAAQEFSDKFSIPVFAAASLDDLIAALSATPSESGDDLVGEMLVEILAYRKKYGAR